MPWKAFFSSLLHSFGSMNECLLAERSSSSSSEHFFLHIRIPYLSSSFISLFPIYRMQERERERERRENWAGLSCTSNNTIPPPPLQTNPAAGSVGAYYNKERRGSFAFVSSSSSSSGSVGSRSDMRRRWMTDVECCTKASTHTHARVRSQHAHTFFSLSFL